MMTNKIPNAKGILKAAQFFKEKYEALAELEDHLTKIDSLQGYHSELEKAVSQMDSTLKKMMEKKKAGEAALADMEKRALELTSDAAEKSSKVAKEIIEAAEKKAQSLLDAAQELLKKEAVALTLVKQKVSEKAETAAQLEEKIVKKMDEYAGIQKLIQQAIKRVTDLT